MSKLNVLNREVGHYKLNDQDYICITDIAKYRSPDTPADIIKNWLRSRSTIDFIGLWEKLNNPNFKLLEFDQFKREAGNNYFVLSPQKWIESTHAIGLVSRAGRTGGTFAHKDIAFEFASWISSEFKLYLITEFQRLKEKDSKQIGWDVHRTLTKINYRIHTDAIKTKLIPKEVTTKQTKKIYASEADVLNMALFGVTAKDWQKQNPSLKGNIRDYADVSQLVCLSNLESLNALFINDGMKQSQRLIKLNKVAIQQMKLLTEDTRLKKLEHKTKP
jgi:hypothetical protein